MRAFILWAVVCLCVAGCKKEEPSKTVTRAVRDAPPPASAPFDGKTPHDFGEFSFNVPAGWVVVTPELDVTKTLIMQGGDEWPGAKAMVKIDTETPNVESPRAMADVFASNTAGTVLEDPVDFDGTPGIKVDASNQIKTSQRHLVAVFRNDLAYMMTVNSQDGVAVADAVESIRSSWKWKNPEVKKEEAKGDESKAEAPKDEEAQSKEKKGDGI